VVTSGSFKKGKQPVAIRCLLSPTLNLTLAAVAVFWR